MSCAYELDTCGAFSNNAVILQNSSNIIRLTQCRSKDSSAIGIRRNLCLLVRFIDQTYHRAVSSENSKPVGPYFEARVLPGAPLRRQRSNGATPLRVASGPSATTPGYELEQRH